MKTINVAEATGPALDYLAAKAEGMALKHDPMGFSKDAPGSLQAGWWIWPERGNCMVVGRDFAPSTNPSQGFPIVDGQRISWDGHSYAVHPNFKPSPTGGDVHPIGMHGSNYLVAALRCHVAVRLGLEVEVPDELLA